ncbi:MAG TPA: hypothetical protein VLF95_09020 [Vicinamibacteria bacterium]|nr:hypothetical protein [Vicinamibacteria bacterium]
MTPSLQRVSDQFPHLRERVARLFDRDEIFRELCEDYEACVQALSQQERNEDMRREYAALRLRLETELLGYLHEAEEPRPRK